MGVVGDLRESLLIDMALATDRACQQHGDCMPLAKLVPLKMEFTHARLPR